MKELRVKANDESLQSVMALVDEELEALECPMPVMMQIDVAVEELFVNIAHYAYPEGEGEAVVRVKTLSLPRGVEITFIDSGIQYDPLSRADPDVTLSAEERQIGGLGIYLVKKTMDSVAYKYEDGKNVLCIVKNF